MEATIEQVARLLQKIRAGEVDGDLLEKFLNDPRVVNNGRVVSWKDVPLIERYDVERSPESELVEKFLGDEWPAARAAIKKSWQRWGNLVTVKFRRQVTPSESLVAFEGLGISPANIQELLGFGMEMEGEFKQGVIACGTLFPPERGKQAKVPELVGVTEYPHGKVNYNERTLGRPAGVHAAYLGVLED